MKIAVLGAGVIGLSTAYWLARDGHEIVLIDRNRLVAQDASFANGGQLSYNYVAPLASPSVLRSLPKWLLRADSPVRFRLAADLDQLLWTLSFLLSCNSRRSRKTTEALLSLAEYSRQALHDCVETERLEFAYRRNGKIVFFSNPASLRSARKQVDIQAPLGRPQTILGKAECLDVEPALKAAADRIVGAVYTPSEEAGDCHQLCRELARVLAGPGYRVDVRLGATATDFIHANRSILGLSLGRETVEADLYVVCSGNDSRQLVSKLGLRLPLYPIRGYSISPDIREATAAPDKSITDYDRRIVYARLGRSLRVAGYAEIVGDGVPVDGGSIDTLKREVEDLFPGSCALDRLRPWVGKRPATPTSLPIIGGTSYRNLLVNVGQGALGFTLGSGSGKVLADIVAGRRTCLDLNEDGSALPQLRTA
jgi:D-amino-acid dehydrogenase